MINSKRGLVLFIIILVSFLFLVNYFSVVEITGYSIFERRNYVFNFSENTYIFNNSIVLESGVRLNNYSIFNSTVRNVVFAIRDGHDDTSKIISVDNEIANVDKEKLFDVSFDGLINNGDVVRVYIFGEEEGDLWLCDKSSFCDKPGYGLVHYIRSENQGIFYNITVSGLNNLVDGFNFDPKELKFDYIEVMHNEIIKKYYSYGEIETNEIEINGTIKILNVIEELNGQIIEYYYFVGEDWIRVYPGILNLNVSKIKIKAILKSNGEVSPFLNFISLDYEVLNEENIILPGDNQTINETLPNENNTMINQTSNETVVVSSPSGGGGGGGSNSRSSSENVELKMGDVKPIILESSERRGNDEPEIVLVEQDPEILPTGSVTYVNRLFGNTNYNIVLLLLLSILWGYVYREKVKRWLKIKQ